MEDARFDRVPSESPLISLVLRAYCLALVKACDFVHARIVTEYYYEVVSRTVRMRVKVYY
jgi:hypothetical protein